VTFELEADVTRDELTWLFLQGAAEISPTFGGVTARAVEGVQ
jgi:hypothetical protein